jgi:hypothetical protein
MEQAEERERRIRANFAFALSAGLVVFVLLFPWGGGVNTDPPTCFGMFGWYTVPCDGWVAPVAGAATAGVAYLVLWLRNRRSGPS